MLVALLDAHKSGRGPMSFFELKAIGRWNDARVNRILDYAVDKGWVVKCAGITDFTGTFVLARDISELPIADMLREFLHQDGANPKGLETAWKESIDHWLGYFGDRKFSSLLVDKPRKRK
jgi:hypothetical protein